MKLKGTDILMYVLRNGEVVPVALGRKASFSVDREMLKVAGSTDGQAEEYIPGKRSAEMQCDCLLSDNISAVREMYDEGEEVITFWRDASGSDGTQRQWRGDMLIKSLKVTGNIHDMGTLNVSMKGTAEIVYVRVPNPYLLSSELYQLVSSDGYNLQGLQG